MYAFRGKMVCALPRSTYTFKFNLKSPGKEHVNCFNRTNMSRSKWKHCLKPGGRISDRLSMI